MTFLFQAYGIRWPLVHVSTGCGSWNNNHNVQNSDTVDGQRIWEGNYSNRRSSKNEVLGYIRAKNWRCLWLTCYSPRFRQPLKFEQKHHFRKQWCRNRGRGVRGAKGANAPTKCLAAQLTLFQPGEGRFSPLITTAHIDIYKLRQEDRYWSG